MLVTIVRTSGRLIATGVRIIKISTGPKPDPGISAFAVIFLIGNYADSYLRGARITEPPNKTKVIDQQCIYHNFLLPLQSLFKSFPGQLQTDLKY